MIRFFAIVLAGAWAVEMLPRGAFAQGCSDTTAPLIAVTHPTRGAALVVGGGADADVLVEGQASDGESALTSLVVAGIELLPAGGSATESFSVSTVSPWGLNVVEIAATDACGNTREIAHAFLRSGSFKPAATGPSAAGGISNGVLTHLNALALDDGSRADRDDVATVIQGGVTATNMNPWVPTVFLQQSLLPCTCSLRCPFSTVCCIGDLWDGASPGAMRITRGTITGPPTPVVAAVTAGSGRVTTTASLGAISMPLTFTNYACNLGNLSTTAYPASFHMDGASVVLPMTPSVSDGQAQFAIADDVAIDLVNPVLTPACGIAQPICNVVAGAIFGFIEDEFEAALASTVLPMFPPLFETFVEAHDLPSSIATDAPTPGEIGVDATLGSLRVVGTAPTGALEIGARTQAYPQTRAPGIPAGAAGAVQRSGAIPAFLASPLGQSLRDDYVNQVLWSLWYEGGFESLELTSDSVTHGLPAQALSASALLPPILRPGTTGSEIEIALGDLRLVARLDLAQVLGPPAHGTVDVTALVSTRVRGMPAVDDARQKLGFEAAAAEASVEIVSPDDAALAAALEAPIGSFVESWLPPVLERLVSGIRLPATPVSTTGFELGLGSGSADRPDADQTRLSGLLVERPRCGDGLLRGGEACDDGDGSLGDGCDDACSVEPGYACSGQPSVCTYVADVDADGIVDIADNCPYSANAAQADVGGVGDGSAPDGIGDACQCGDATGDGRISDDDVTAVRDGLRGDSSAVLAPERCSVSGALDAILAATGLRRDCDIADASRLARALLGLAPSLGQLCAPALP